MTVSGVHLVGEGSTDIALLQRLADDHGVAVRRVWSTGGADALDRALPRYAKAALSTGDTWIALRDLDRHDCAASLVGHLIPKPPASMHLRIAVRQLEAWLLADADGLSRTLRIRPNAIPLDVEDLDDAKAKIASLASHATSPLIRKNVAPRRGHRVGAGYTAVVGEFIRAEWSWKRARERSDSLDRCCRLFERLAETRA